MVDLIIVHDINLVFLVNYKPKLPYYTPLKYKQVFDYEDWPHKAHTPYVYYEAVARDS